MRRCLRVAFAALALLAAGASGADGGVVGLRAGEQRPLSLDTRIDRVAVGDPAVADVKVISERELLLTAKSPGSTDVHVWLHGRAEPVHHRVRVRAALDLDQAISERGLRVEENDGVLRLEGESGSLEGHAQALNTLRGRDMPVVDASRLGFSNQVQTDIQVVEISREKMRQAGLFLSKNTGNTTLAVSPPGALSGVESGGNGFTLESAAGFLPGMQAFNLISGNANKGLLNVLSILESRGFAYTLAEPSLVSLSGQSASFLVGGEFPIPVRQGSGSGDTVTIVYKEFGVRLTLTPTVLDPERIMLKVAPEVSELDFSAGIESGGVSVPALRIRRTETSVQLGDGESFVISGLVSQGTLANVDKVPGLGDLPVLGAFFRSSRIDRQDKELVMVVTPHLVRPLARDAARPPLPGEAYRDYDPDTADFIFMETGSFVERNTGFSD